MSHDNVLDWKNPGVSSTVRDALTELLREGARTLLAQAVEAEVAEFLARYQDERDETGRARRVRNGHLPERTIQTGMGQVAVKAPRVHDRSGQGRFSSSLVPRYLRRTRSIEELLPWLYLKGISSGEFSEALAALLGADAPGLSPGTISRLKAVWLKEHAHWEQRSLANKRYVYLWVDGIHFGVRLDAANQCILVVIGATPEGRKELVVLADGFRESEQSWKEGLLGLKNRGMKIDPELPLAMAPSASGRRCRRSLAQRGNNGAGCIRRRTCSTSYPSICNRKRNRTGTKSGWLRPGNGPTLPSMLSCKATSRSIPRRRSA